MSRFMKELSLTGVAILTAVMIGLSGCVPVEAQAACINNYQPATWVYTQKYADGSTLIQISEWDSDNLNNKGVVMYNTQGQIIPTTIPGAGFFSNVKPKSAVWYSVLKDVDVCGNFVKWTYGPRFQ